MSSASGIEVHDSPGAVIAPGAELSGVERKLHISFAGLQGAQGARQLRFHRPQARHVVVNDQSAVERGHGQRRSAHARPDGTVGTRTQILMFEDRKTASENTADAVRRRHGVLDRSACPIAHAQVVGPFEAARWVAAVLQCELPPRRVDDDDGAG